MNPCHFTASLLLVYSSPTLSTGPLMVWAAMGETPTWRVFVGAAGIMVTMGVESWIGLRESANSAAAEGGSREKEEKEAGGQEAGKEEAGEAADPGGPGGAANK